MPSQGDAIVGDASHFGSTHFGRACGKHLVGVFAGSVAVEGANAEGVRSARLQVGEQMSEGEGRREGECIGLHRQRIQSSPASR